MTTKKFFLFFLIVFLTISEVTFGQSEKSSVEILYFKANLACCKARACNALQKDVDSVIIKYFLDKNIEFKVIRIADTANKDLVEKYNAQSQTVIIRKKNNSKETSKDVSEIVQEYAMFRDKKKFEDEMIKAITEFIK